MSYMSRLYTELTLIGYEDEQISQMSVEQALELIGDAKNKLGAN